MTEKYYSVAIEFHHAVGGQMGYTLVNFTTAEIKEFRNTAWRCGVAIETARGTKQLVSPFSIKEIFIITQEGKQ